MATAKLTAAADSQRTQDDVRAGISASNEPQGTCPNGWIARIKDRPLRTRAGGVRRFGSQDAALKKARQVVDQGRQHIAAKAQADNEPIFAREVLGGCWDHRDDVRNAIATFGNL